MNRGMEFMELHRSGTFVMVNVADAGIARAACEAGASSIATTSGGIEAAVEAARALDRPFVITGRTDVLLYAGGEL